jgi:hypothetical protein
MALSRQRWRQPATPPITWHDGLVADQIVTDSPDPQADRTGVAMNAAAWALYSGDGRPIRSHDPTGVPMIDVTAEEVQEALLVAQRVLAQVDSHDERVAREQLQLLGDKLQGLDLSRRQAEPGS